MSSPGKHSECARSVQIANITGSLFVSLFCRNDIQKRGLIPALTEPLKSESIKIQSQASKAIACFVTGMESRAEVLMTFCLAL